MGIATKSRCQSYPACLFQSRLGSRWCMSSTSFTSVCTVQDVKKTTNIYQDRERLLEGHLPSSYHHAQSRSPSSVASVPRGEATLTFPLLRFALGCKPARFTCEGDCGQIWEAATVWMFMSIYMYANCIVYMLLYVYHAALACAFRAHQVLL